MHDERKQKYDEDSRALTSPRMQSLIDRYNALPVLEIDATGMVHLSHAVIDVVIGRSLDAAYEPIHAHTAVIQSVIELAIASRSPLPAEQPWLAAINTALAERSADINSYSLSQTLRMSPNALVDFDWSVSQVIGSDTVANVRAPILTLTVDTASQQTRTVELTLAQLDSLIGSLEQAKLCIKNVA